MKRMLGVTLALVLGLAVGAWAGDVTGKIQAIDLGERSLVLDNGTKIWVAEGVSMDALKEGANVKASYEERDGKMIATSVEAAD